jgi:antitoxin VapB
MWWRSSAADACLPKQAVDRLLYIPYIRLMNAPVKTSMFKSGNSVALRLPKACGFKPGDGIELVRKGGIVEIHPMVDLEKEKAELSELVRILRELGPTKNPAQREPIEFPDRPGLY